MSCFKCFACEEAGTQPKKAKGHRLMINPRIFMAEPPTIEGHRLGAEFMARRVYSVGIEEALKDYDVDREELLLCCWWAGSRYNPRWTKLKRALRDWSSMAAPHLWYGCIQIPDPPRKGDADGRQD